MGCSLRGSRMPINPTHWPPAPGVLCSMFRSCRTIAQLCYISRVAGKILLGIKRTPHFGSCPESVLGIMATSPTSARPEVSGIWYQISLWDLVVLSWLPQKRVE